MVPLFYDAETFLRKRNGIAEVLQTNFLLDVIVVFGRQGGDEILYGNAGIGSSLTFQFFQFLSQSFWARKPLIPTPTGKALGGVVTIQQIIRFRGVS